MVLNLSNLGDPIPQDVVLVTPRLRSCHRSKWLSLLFVHLGQWRN